MLPYLLELFKHGGVSAVAVQPPAIYPADTSMARIGVADTGMARVGVADTGMSRKQS